MSEPRLTEAELDARAKALCRMMLDCWPLGTKLEHTVLAFTLRQIAVLENRIDRLERRLAEPCRRCKGCE